MQRVGSAIEGKRFFAADMRQAHELVRASSGGDASIIATPRSRVADRGADAGRDMKRRPDPPTPGLSRN